MNFSTNWFTTKWSKLWSHTLEIQCRALNPANMVFPVLKQNKLFALVICCSKTTLALLRNSSACVPERCSSSAGRCAGDHLVLNCERGSQCTARATAHPWRNTVATPETKPSYQSFVCQLLSNLTGIIPKLGTASALKQSKSPLCLPKIRTLLISRR